MCYNQFTNAVVNLCQLLEVTEARMGITSSRKTVVLELLLKLSYASSQQQYEDLYSQLKNLQIATVTDYYDTNWHNCRHSWVPCFKNSASNMGTTGTQRIESLHQKVKEVVHRSSEIKQFFENLLIFLAASQSASEHRVMDACQRFPTNNPETALSAYRQEVSQHAFNLITQKHASSTNVVLEGTSVQSHEGVLTVSSSACQCQFFKVTSLPCRHIFKFRDVQGRPVFDPVLVPQCWKRSYWLAAVRTHTLHSGEVAVSVQTSTQA